MHTWISAYNSCFACQGKGLLLFFPAVLDGSSREGYDLLRLGRAAVFLPLPPPHFLANFETPEDDDDEG